MTAQCKKKLKRIYRVKNAKLLLISTQIGKSKKRTRFSPVSAIFSSLTSGSSFCRVCRLLNLPLTLVIIPIPLFVTNFLPRFNKYSLTASYALLTSTRKNTLIRVLKFSYFWPEYPHQNTFFAPHFASRRAFLARKLVYTPKLSTPLKLLTLYL